MPAQVDKNMTKAMNSLAKKEKEECKEKKSCNHKIWGYRHGF